MATARGNVLRLSQLRRPLLPIRGMNPVCSVRRFDSAAGVEKLPNWAAHNEFNREREAVKEHAVGTSSTCLRDAKFLRWIDHC